MITKEKLIKHINKFPSELSIDELIDRLVFIEKLERRIEQSKNNETITEQELENEMKEWFK
jgi:flagellar biosynthesis chaperone FliJ